MLLKVPVRNGHAVHAELAARPAVQLGAATLHPGTRTLSGPAGSVRLEPKVMHVLLLLADAAGETVTRDTLLCSAWDGLFIDDSGVRRVIAAIRRAATAVDGEFTIETITKAGYRLIEDGPAAASLGPSRLLPRRALLIGAGASVFGLALAGRTALQSRPGRAEARELRQRAELALREMSYAGDRQAVALLQEATRVAPDDSQAWGKLALAYQRIAEAGPMAERVSAAARTESAAKRALLLKLDQPDALIAQALAIPVFGNWQASERTLLGLLKRFPDNVFLLAGYAKLLAEVGRFDDAMRVSDRLFAREPLGPAFHWRRALGLWAAGRTVESESLIDRARRLWPLHPTIWSTAFWLRAYTGRGRDALRLLDDPAGGQLPVEHRSFMARAASMLLSNGGGDAAAAISANRRSAAQSTSNAEHAMAIAGALGIAGEALLIAQAYYFGRPFEVAPMRSEPDTAMHQRDRKTLILFWPPMAEVRRGAEFGRLTAHLGLDRYWRQAGLKPDYLLGSRNG